MSKKVNSFRTPIGTRDLLPPDSARWEAVVEVFGRTAARSGFGLLNTPLFEDIGEDMDEEETRLSQSTPGFQM